MRSLVVLPFLIFFGYCLEIQVNFGKEKGEDFSVINLKHPTPFECVEKLDIYSNVTSVLCTIPQTPINNFVPTNTAFFGFSNIIKDHHLILEFTPKYKAKLFATFLDLKKQNRIPKERPKKSKNWQIVGYITDIPFLSNKSVYGLNFPIQIATTSHPYMSQLDINLKPLKYKEGIDFQELQSVKTLFDKKDYEGVVKSAISAMETFPTSIFYKDFLYYKIKGLSFLTTEENLDLIVNSALQWIKTSATDKSAPEVLYLLANAYMTNHLDNEAYYYYKRIINEYPQTDWNALAKMQIAKNFSESKTLRISTDLFPEAYQEAKTQSTKKMILVEWGISELLQNPKEAKSLIDAVLKQDPHYFSSNPTYALATIKTLAERNAFNLAGKIGASLLPQLSKNDDRLQNLMFDLGKWYELAKNTKEAHFYNEKFLSTYPQSELAPSVKARDHQLIFKMGKNLDITEQIKVLDKIIQDYPNSQEAKDAYAQKAKLLFDSKQYQELLKFADSIPQSPLVPQAKTQIILDLLSKKQCKSIPQFFQGSNIEAFQGKVRLELFDCLYALSYYDKAQSLIENPKEAQDKLPWLYRLSKVLNKKGEFAKSRLAGSDSLELAKTLQKNQYNDIAFVIFDDLIELKLFEQAQKVSLFLNQHFAKDKRMLEVWYSLFKQAQKDNQQNSVQIYARDILKLQKDLKLKDYTPSVDFILIFSLIQTKQYTEAKQWLNTLLQEKIKPQDMQKALYMQGSILKAMGEEYKSSFEKCLKIQDQTSWRDLCSKSL